MRVSLEPPTDDQKYRTVTAFTVTCAVFRAWGATVCVEKRSVQAWDLQNTMGVHVQEVNRFRSTINSHHAWKQHPLDFSRIFSPSIKIITVFALASEAGSYQGRWRR